MTSRFSNISSRKRLILKKSVTSKNIKAIFPLTEGQKSLLYIASTQPHTSAFHVYAALRLAGDLDGEKIEKALQHVLNQHEILETAIDFIDGEPVHNSACTGK
ncbi:Condensation domain-containing protein [Alteromonadaceae bacterium Bs31]|nr:Condensation domain-containing protein [Alteromonadaceae bacterium Bs31]